MIAIHNSRSAEYRKPFGAVKLGGTVFLALDIFEADDVSVICRLWVDKKGEQLIEMQPEIKDGFIRFSCSFTPEEAQLVWYSFIISHDGKISRLGTKQGRTGGEGVIYYHEPPSFQITVYKERKLPEWYRNAVVYQIFPDRFCRGDDWQQRVKESLSVGRNGPDRELCEDWYKTPHYKKDEKGRVVCWDFYGGTLSGIEKKLGYLKELGVTALYLNPIFEAASNHRYDTADYNKLDAMLGEDGYFEKFAEKAKRYGIRIILDGVFNHTGCDSIYFNRYGNYDSVGAIQSEQSPYRDWFKIKPDGSYECWWGVDDLPDLEETNPEYRDFIFGENGIVRRWLKAGASGWRLDVADELPDDFIVGIKEAVTETLGSEGVLLGEVWEDASNKISYGELRRYFLGDELDSAMNYPLRDAVIGFLTGKITPEQAAEDLYSLYENYPHEAFYGALNLFGSHDRARLLTMLGDAPEENSLSWEQRRDYKLSEEQCKLAKNRLWLATLIQMTMPGVPCIYYGDEAGMEGYSDPYNRGTYPWEKEDADTAAIYRNALSLRRLLPVFTDGDFRPFYFGIDVFGIIRKYKNKTAVVMINRSSEWQQVEVPAFANRCSELVSGLSVTVEGDKAKLTMPSFGSAVVYFDEESGLAKPLEKGAGVICHITSLPNRDKPGCFGEPSKKFIDFLSSAGVKYWQMLPLNPTDSYGSPYAGLSAFAGNTDLIYTDGKTLSELYGEFTPDADYKNFCSENAFWLERYAAFMALKDKFEDAQHCLWPKEYRSFSDKVLKDTFVSERAAFYKFCQYEFFKQWDEVHRYANSKGVKIIGDMPIYLSEDSADVWAYPQLFNLDEEGRKTECAGVPPDYFSEEGQHWGNPTYNWQQNEQQGFSWWIERLKHSFNMFDHVRLDHFRAFEAYWSIENGKKAIEGRWIPGPGAKLFKAAFDKLGQLPIIAEDLGVITTGVRALIAECGFSGMDVIQFYDSDPILGYQPPENKIVYTGTHDNQTLLGWCAEKYGEQNAKEYSQKLIKSAMLTNSDVVILPLQDVFGLDDSARMNVPGVAIGNWKWQAADDDFTNHLEWLKKLLEDTERS